MKAVIYTSNTGFTRKYAQMLSEQLSLPAYNARLGEDRKQLSKEDTVSERYAPAVFPRPMTMLPKTSEPETA